MLKILGVITARSGSKSLKNKNIKKFLKHPLLAHSIYQSLNSKLINKTIVSTDSEKYAKISKNYGAEIPFIRPKRLAKDKTEDIEVFLDLLKKLEKIGYKPDYIVHLRPTSPLRKISDIDKSIKVLIKNKDCDSVRSVNLSKKNLFKSWFMQKGLIKPIYQGKTLKEPWNKGRQYLPKTFTHNGNIDVIKYKTIKKLRSMTGKKTIPLIQTDLKNLFDIDDYNDFKSLNKIEKKILKKFDLLGNEI
jgi:CMP-N,N'-diacetyllegionaminic acid synthase